MPRPRAATAALLGVLALGSCKRSTSPAAGSEPTSSAAPAAQASISVAASDPLPRDGGSGLRVATEDAAPSASSAPAPLPEPESPPALPKALAQSPPRPSTQTHAGFAGPVDPSKDRALLASLASAPITKIERNPGGATLTLRIRLGDGRRAVLKPEQKHSASNLRAEIAAYHVDRILGFGRTAVVVGRSVSFQYLRQHLLHAETDAAHVKRFDEEVVAHEGRVATAVIAWHAGRLANAQPPKDWTSGLRLAAPVAQELVGRLPEWSDMIVFDFLIDNTDRWSGGNVLSLGAGGPLIFLDNAAGFAPWRAARNETLASRLEPVCRFRRATVDALKSVGPTAEADRRLGALLRRSLSRDPLAPVLGERQYSALDARVERLLEHVARCEAELGEETVLSL